MKLSVFRVLAVAPVALLPGAPAGADAAQRGASFGADDAGTVAATPMPDPRS